MKSIRLSLVVYFLVLLTVALGAVYALVYQLAAAALGERMHSAQELIRKQYEAQCIEVRKGLDKRLVREAQRVAAMARSPLHVEGLYPLGVMTVPFAFQPHLHVWLWASEGAIPRGRDAFPGYSIAERLVRLRSTEVDIEAAEDMDLILPSDSGHAQEYFQVFLGNGKPSKRSKSLGDHVLKLPDMSDAGEPIYDTIELGPDGREVRRVTLKTSLTRSTEGGFPPYFWWGRPLGGGKGPPPPKQAVVAPGGGPGGPPRAFWPRPIFIQYAIDLGPTGARLQQAADERDDRITQLDAENQTQLRALRNQLVWIAIGTFIATLAGGYVLLRLGLAPIGRLSDAVSEVTERDFRLKVDPSRLPVELQPIARRLSQTLEQLGRAFDREKQAAADISHELRTPLAALLTTVEVALRKSRSVQEYREILEECRLSGEQMSHMVQRLLALARLDAGAERARPRVVDAGELALGCADLIRPLARARGLTLTAHVAPPLPVEIDPDKLREVVTNLLHNAVEYNRDGGTIELTVERSGGNLCIDVTDTGIGIDAGARAHIFERFYRADPSRHADTPHAGLGLAIVKGYVDLLGGTIAVESTPNVGTAFHIRLPVPAVGEPSLSAQPLEMASK
jgi:heavy metal sensor kinase